MPDLYCISNAETRGPYFFWWKKALRVGNRKQDFLGVSRRQFSCWRCLCDFYGIEASFSRIFSWVCTSLNVNVVWSPISKRFVCVHSRSAFRFCRFSRVNECNASKPLPSGGAFIRVSKFQVNLGCPNRQRKCFPTTKIFRRNWNHHQLQRCVENAATKCRIHRKASLMMEFSRISIININLPPSWR